jgi:Tol biopolymer transport system component
VADLPTPPDPSDIYTVAPDGTGLRRITTDGDPKGPLAWSPDGRTLAYTASPIGGETAQLWVVDADGQNARMVCAGCDGTFDVPRPNATQGGPFVWFPRMIAWSPSGRWIASTASGGGLALIRPTTGQVVAVPTGDVGGLSWSPDSSSIAIMVQWEGLEIYDLSTDQLRHLASNELGLMGPVAWSPDGSTIAYANAVKVGDAIREGVIAVDPSGHNARTLMPDRSTFGVYDLRWSPDGSRLAVTYHPIDPPTAALLTMAADGSDVRTEALCEDSHETDGLCPPNGDIVLWSPDGTQLLFDNFSDPGGHAFVVLAADRSAVQISGTLVPGCCISWQPSQV